MQSVFNFLINYNFLVLALEILVLVIVLALVVQPSSVQLSLEVVFLAAGVWVLEVAANHHEKGGRQKCCKFLELHQPLLTVATMALAVLYLHLLVID